MSEIKKLNTEKLNMFKNNVANNEDKIFNKLKDLQKLVKKESAIKELFIKTKNETKKSIENHCIDIYKKKMELLNILQKINKTTNNSSKESTDLLKDYILVESSEEYLFNLYMFIKSILNNLWEEPEILANLLIKANKEETKKYLAPLICNNFYENILSPNYIQDQLIYIIYLLLKNEIESFKDINEGIKNFLNDTPCSYLLQQLIEKDDIKEFFKLILQDSLEDLGSDKFIFNINELNKWQLEMGKKINKSIFDRNYLNSKNVDNRGNRLSKHKKAMTDVDLGKAKTLAKIDIQGITDDDRETIKNNINYQVFSAVYLTSIPISEIKENITKHKDDIHLRNYYEYLLSNAKGDYSQTSFFENIIKLKDSEAILVFYQENFLKVKEFLDTILENLTSNYRIIPYAIKCVSKIIYQLVNKKFPKATIIQKNLFINKFLYRTLMFPIFEKPDIHALINDYIISNNTLYNMRIICNIIWTLVTFDMFKDKDSLKGDLTPFNRVFLEKIPEVFKINRHMININLPNFIDGLLNKTINENEYCFDYFNENPNDISFYKSMLLNIKEFNSLFKNLLAHQDEILKPNSQNTHGKSQNVHESNYTEFMNRSEKNKQYIKIVLKKINSDINLNALTELVNAVEYTVIRTKSKGDSFLRKNVINEERREQVKYFHISELLFNERSNKIFSLEQKYFYYHIKELNEKDSNNLTSKELQTKNNIIKFKNFCILILYNYRNLEKIDFNQGTTNTFINILKELTPFMKSSNYLIDGKIPSDWYLVSLMECLKKLPNEYKINEYKKLFDELTFDLNKSIKNCDFEYMSLLLDGIKFANRNKNFQERVKEIYMDIELNNKANNIIENDIINININYKPNLKNIKLDSFNIINLENFFKSRSDKTIEKFTKDFPNLNDYKFNNVNSDETINIFELQKTLDIPNIMKTFFDNIHEYLKDKVKNENELNIITDKISDYVMSRIYDKIYPKVRNNIDIKIFKNTCKLNWVEPENIIKDKMHYDFDFVLPDINKYFNLIRNEKSARKKLINVRNIIECILKLLKFTKGNVPLGVDDQFPLLIYCFIKCKPWGIFTDCNFMHLYIGNKINKIEDSQLTQLFTVCDFIKDENFKSFYNISETEYTEKGEASLNELNEYMLQFNLDYNSVS